MGLLDILNGMQNGPRGQRQPAPPGQSGGMSPIMMALLGLLAYKAVKHMSGSGTPAGAPGTPSAPPGSTPLPPETRTAEGGGGGLGDILGGILNGPGGNANRGSVPSAGSSGGGLGDILGSILGGGRPAAPGTPPPSRAGAPGGDLGSLLGGLLAGGAAGTVLSGGLGQILQDLQHSGQGGAAQSWVGSGSNQEIAPHDLANALGADTISALTQQTGMSRDELLQGLSQHLPELVDQLTPDGRLPTEKEAQHW
jgi:uncharacterized protein YidB (DUF937 family)